MVYAEVRIPSNQIISIFLTSNIVFIDFKLWVFMIVIFYLSIDSDTSLISFYTF